MKNGECCLEELSCNEYIDQCVIFGETFYIQLFINYNLFHVQNIKVWHTDRNLWAQDINIIYVSELHIKESNAVVIYCGFNQNDKEKYVDLIDYDFFEMRSIREKGIFNYQGKDYIVDDVKFVASNPDYMSRAYKDIDTGNLLNYLQELAKAPAGRRIDEKGQICLWDYNSCFINQKRGRRVTLEASNCKKKIHIFGDSRVSGYMLEDKDLFSNILQHLLNDAEIDYGIINYGIPGREIERMEFQLEKAKLRAGDIVFIMTACHEYRVNPFERQQQFALHMKKIKSICDKRNVKRHGIVNTSIRSKN